MKNIIIWGIGKRFNRYMRGGYFLSCNILALVDTHKANEVHYGYTVIGPQKVLDIMKNCDAVVITSTSYIEIYKQCLRLNIPKEKIMS